MRSNSAVGKACLEYNDNHSNNKFHVNDHRKENIEMYFLLSMHSIKSNML